MRDFNATELQNARSDSFSRPQDEVELMQSVLVVDPDTNETTETLSPYEPRVVIPCVFAQQSSKEVIAPAYAITDDAEFYFRRHAVVNVEGVDRTLEDLVTSLTTLYLVTYKREPLVVPRKFTITTGMRHGIVFSWVGARQITT
jgi:hypothetical protein